ncbi:hypothetical protein BKA59DRAFT_305407 [Fusarium tricinctum]|uniref:Uncharacterized protein n=1 Tax=Fusarium tricinctum TaxID=61284 RepID=A0A8K0RRA1_9HYPO|nr:hypothetical protein BKA59DRAFT_305407 [Fusarium tricinctum]
MSQYQFRMLFECPHLGRNVVSESPPVFNAATELDEGPILGLDPEAFPYGSASDTDTGDEYEPEDDESEIDCYRHRSIQTPWHPHALRFLTQLPQNDIEWSRYLSCNDDVRSLCHRLKIPSLYPGFQAHLDWSRLFDECTKHLADACRDPPLASLFSLVFVATCHVALSDGCPHETVFSGLSACLRQCGVADEELSKPMLDRVIEGVVTGIGILREYTMMVGCRANEIPLHVQDCLQIFQRCNSVCFASINNNIPSIYRPTTPLQSECLEIPALVYDLLGGRHSKWEYQVICQILCPGGTSGIIGYNNVDMTDVMELNERDDRDVRGRDLEIGLTLMTNIVNN